ncbi:UvrD-helicase domain-containing protein [Chloroflexota bacterium]
MCVEYPPNHPLIVVAGPGTGKTTAIATRALKMVFVDRYDPASILLTPVTLT